MSQLNRSLPELEREAPGLVSEVEPLVFAAHGPDKLGNDSRASDYEVDALKVSCNSHVCRFLNVRTVLQQYRAAVMLERLLLGIHVGPFGKQIAD